MNKYQKFDLEMMDRRIENVQVMAQAIKEVAESNINTKEVIIDQIIEFDKCVESLVCGAINAYGLEDLISTRIIYED